ncbi:MAG: Ig-like domain-containing protein [Pseudomonadota bacterium]
MKTPLTALITALTFCAGAAAQDAASDPDVRFTGSDGNARLSYTGDYQRLGVGIDDDGDLHGEYLHVFGEDENSNWIGELWLSDERGGVKLNYHWITGASSLEEAASNQGQARIAKTFLALDQNEHDDRKVTLGLGWEGPDLFWGAYVMKAVTGRRLIDQLIDTEVSQISGVSGNQQFVQDQFLDTITTIYERAYDHGGGLRVGRYFDDQLVRVRGGLDFEQGRDGADQRSINLGIEKFFAGTPHSLALTAEYLDRSGDFVTDESDTRAVLYYRYAFGQRHRPSYKAARDIIERRIETVTEPRPAVTEARLVRNEATLNEAVLFDLDRFSLKSGAQENLNAVLQKIRSMNIVGAIRVEGHTCDLASDEYNEALSQRRADAVVAYLTGEGIAGDDLEVRALGESEPAVPNTSEANRQRNRRVEIEFVTLEERTEDVVIEPAVPGGTEVTWEREEIDDPAWLERALKNPVAHKREVDTYRYAEVDTAQRLGPQVVFNTFPTAQDDTATTFQDRAITIDVLANDSDPDGDALTLTAVTAAANGTASLSGGGVLYTPNPGFFGTDTFSYSASDAGGEASATVTVTVLEQPPIEALDDQATTRRTQPVSVSVLANDTGEGLTLVSVGTAANGSVSIEGSQVVYTPEQSFVGSDNFTYTAEDETGQQASAVVTIVVDAFNTPPVATDDEAVTRKNTPVLIDVLANDFDPDGDPLTITAVDGKTPFGSAVITADQQILYTPMSGWWGGDEFTYTVEDGFGGTATATIRLSVTSQSWGR